MLLVEAECFFDTSAGCPVFRDSLLVLKVRYSAKERK